MRGERFNFFSELKLKNIVLIPELARASAIAA